MADDVRRSARMPVFRRYSALEVLEEVWNDEESVEEDFDIDDGSDSDEEETYANQHHPLLSAHMEQREDSDSDFDPEAAGTASESDIDMKAVAPIIII